MTTTCRGSDPLSNTGTGDTACGTDTHARCELDRHRSEPSEDAPTSAGNAWLAPLEPDTVRLWVVLRTAAGASDLGAYRVDVE